jgi:apolipoprotein N-acyltransferase
LIAALGLAAAFGAAQAASIAWPFAFSLLGLIAPGKPSGSLQILSLAGLMALGWRTVNATQHSTRQRLWRAAALGQMFATTWLAGTFWWLFVSMHTYGGLPAAFAVLAVVALAAFLALPYAAALAAAVWGMKPASSGFHEQNRPLPSKEWRFIAIYLIAFVLAWLLAELVRSSWFTGFPWGAGGYAHVDSALARLLPWVGVYGVGAAAALVAAGVAACWMLRGKTALRFAAMAAAVVGTALFVPFAHDSLTQPVRSFRVQLLQGNIAQDEKFVPGKGIEDALDWYGKAFLAGVPTDASPTLVVAPETAIPLLPRQLPEGALFALTSTFRQGPHALMFGIPLGDFDAGYRNGVLAASAGASQFYSYSKHHLVPFGEFIPWGFKWFTRAMNIPLGDMQAGDMTQTSWAWGDQRLAPNVCYEDLFGNELAARFADDNTAPTALVNISNIGWFGNTIAVDQHLHISRARAMELGRPMIRATNTGATGVIDHLGRVTALAPRHTRHVLTAQAQGRAGITPYASWAARFGHAPLWLLTIFGFVTLVYVRRKLN